MTATNRALAGGVVWVAFVVLRATDMRGDAWAHALLLFAALVLVPLVLELFVEPENPERDAGAFGLARRVQLPAALLLAVACWMKPGFGASVVAMPWAAFTVLLARSGVIRLRREGLRRGLDLLCADMALIFAAVGGAWTLMDRVGFAPLGFNPAIVALTAVHFHYAGLLLPLFAGLVQRELWFWRFASQAAVGVVLGVPAVALGITTTQLGWGPSIEAAAGCGLALAGAAVAVLHVRIALDTKRPVATRVLLGIAGASLFFGMVLAALYAMRTFALPFPWLGIPQMRAIHGTVNAVGFGLCGVLGWRAMARGRVAS
ncbi:MAG: YndJ family transporter [Verrucomicrobiota bacterium]